MIRALVVFDNKSDNLDRLVNTLRTHGCEVKGTERTAEALGICQQMQPDLIIYGDCQGIKAWKFAYELLKDDPQRKPYLAMVTFSPSVLQRCLCEECGFDEYIKAPIELSDLLRFVQKARDRQMFLP